MALDVEVTWADDGVTFLCVTIMYDSSILFIVQFSVKSSRGGGDGDVIFQSCKKSRGDDITELSGGWMVLRR